MKKLVTGSDNVDIAIGDSEELDINDDRLGMGLKIPSTVSVPMTYIDGLRNYSDLYNDIYKQMEVAWKLYKYNGIIGNAVDILCDFAVTEVWAEETGNKELDKMLQYFFKNVNQNNSNNVPGVYPVMQEMALEWFTSGNAFPYVSWDEFDDIPKISGSRKLPSSINLLNPQAIYLPSGPVCFGQEVIYLKLDDKLFDMLRKDGRSDPEAALLKQAVPRSIIEKLKNARHNSFGPGIMLNPKFVSHLKRKSKSYQSWGVPYLSRCFASASLIERLRQLDESISAGLINLITIFKIGTENHPANQARLSAFASLIRNPKATTTLVWAHDIELLQVGPDGKLLAFKDKYKDCKEDLLIALGVPPILMSLNQQGGEWVSILALVEKLSNWRSIVAIWLERLCNQISKENGFEEKVRIKWSNMNLKNENEIKNLILAFHDRGLISLTTALQQAGYDINTEINRKKVEKSVADDFIPPQLPFSGNPETSKSKPNESDPKSIKSNVNKTNTKDKNNVNMKTVKTTQVKEPKVFGG